MPETIKTWADIDFEKEIRPHLNGEAVWDALLRIVKERDKALGLLESETRWAYQYKQERDQARELALRLLVLARRLHAGVLAEGDLDWLRGNEFPEWIYKETNV
jgi:hypothetical protein